MSAIHYLETQHAFQHHDSYLHTQTPQSTGQYQPSHNVAHTPQAAVTHNLQAAPIG
jgi:hypothetical protein